MNDLETTATTDQKETGELLKFGALAINGVSKDMKDGKFGNLADHFPAILAAQPAFQGVSELGNEAAIATVQDKELLRASLLSNMQDVDEDDRYDIAQILGGIHSGYSLGKRTGRKEGADAMREQIRAELKSEGVNISSIRSLNE